LAQRNIAKDSLTCSRKPSAVTVPPPPANQIIHVRNSKPLNDIRTMDAVWISGVLKVEHSDTMMGAAGYSMASIEIEPYTDPTPQ